MLFRLRGRFSSLYYCKYRKIPQRENISNIGELIAIFTQRNQQQGVCDITSGLKDSSAFFAYKVTVTHDDGEYINTMRAILERRKEREDREKRIEDIPLQREDNPVHVS